MKKPGIVSEYALVLFIIALIVTALMSLLGCQVHTHFTKVYTMPPIMPPPHEPRYHSDMDAGIYRKDMERF